MAALGIALLTASASAQRVAVARPAEGDAVLVETFNRLTAELRLQSFEVTVVDAQTNARASDWLESTARRADALASVVLVRNEGRTAVDVWFEDRSVGSPGIRRLESAAGTELPSVLAVRVVDLLRAYLREYRQDPAATPEVTRVPAAESPPPAPVPPPRPWEIRTEGMVLYDNATLGPAFGVALGLGRYVTPIARVGVLVSGPIIGATWETPEGSAFIRQYLGWAEIRLSWWRTHWLDLGASAAGGVHYLGARGEAKLPLFSQSESVWSAAAAVGADGSFRLTSNAALSLTVRAIGLTPKAGVGVGKSMTVLELPLLSASAGLLVGF
jgi:hypothetical protein